MSDDTTLDVVSSEDAPEPSPSPEEIRDLAEELRRHLKAWNEVPLTSFPNGVGNKADFEAMLLTTFRQGLGDQQFHTQRHVVKIIPGVVPTGVDAKKFSRTILEDPTPAPGEDDAYTMWLLHCFREKCRALQDQPEFQFVWRKLDRVLNAKMFQPQSVSGEESQTISLADDFEMDDLPEDIRRRIQDELDDESDFVGETESSVFFSFEPRPIDVTLLDELVDATIENWNSTRSHKPFPPRHPGRPRKLERDSRIRELWNVNRKKLEKSTRKWVDLAELCNNDKVIKELDEIITNQIARNVIEPRSGKRKRSKSR